MDRGDWLIVLLLVAALLVLFAARIASSNGHEFLSLRTLKEVAPWLIAAAVLIGGRELAARIRSRRRNGDQ